MRRDIKSRSFGQSHTDTDQINLRSRACSRHDPQRARVLQSNYSRDNLEMYTEKLDRWLQVKQCQIGMLLDMSVRVCGLV